MAFGHPHLYGKIVKKSLDNWAKYHYNGVGLSRKPRERETCRGWKTVIHRTEHERKEENEYGRLFWRSFTAGLRI